MSKKWLNATFLSFTGFASRIRSRAAKSAKYENLWVFIRSDAHPPRGPSLAPAGQFTLCRQSRIKHKGLRPLINPGVFRQTEERSFDLSPTVPYSFSPSILDIKYAAAQPAVAATMLQMSSDVLLNDTGIMGTVEAITKPIMQ